MAKEVSGFHVQVSLDIGEFFGIPRDELVSFFPGDVPLNSKWTRVDWDPFAAMTAYTCSRIGTTWDLIYAGQSYTYERIGTRFTHLMTQFGGGWDRVLWATKHFFSARLIRGYEFQYAKLGHNHYHMSGTIPETYAGCEDYFWLFTGIWSGGNKISKLKHEILHVDVTPHGVRGEIRFAERNLTSRAYFNPWTSTCRTWLDLRKARKEQREHQEALLQDSRNLQTCLDAVSDPVFTHSGDSPLHAENRRAKELLRAHEPKVRDALKAGELSRRFRVEQEWYECRSKVRIPSEDQPAWMITFENCTHLVNLEQQKVQAPENVRADASTEVRDRLGKELNRAQEELSRFRRAHPDHEDLSLLHSLDELTELCQQQAEALVQEERPEFHQEEDLLRALEDLALDYQRIFTFQVEVEGEQSPFPFSTAQRGELYLIIKEAVRNAYRHSGGTCATIMLGDQGIDVRDNGSGLAESSRFATGLGCKNIRERAARLGLTAEILEIPENGWRLRSS